MLKELLLISSLINTPLYEMSLQTSNDGLSDIFIENLGTDQSMIIVRNDHEYM